MLSVSVTPPVEKMPPPREVAGLPPPVLSSNTLRSAVTEARAPVVAATPPPSPAAWLPVTVLSMKVSVALPVPSTPPPLPAVRPPVMASPSKLAAAPLTAKARRSAAAPPPWVAASSSPSALASTMIAPPPRIVSAWVMESCPPGPRWMAPDRPGAKVIRSAPGFVLA